jgi:cysteine synthase A
MVKIIAVEPTESRVHVGASHSPHTILGIGAGIPTTFVKNLDPDAPLEEGPRGFISEFKHASSVEAIYWAKQLAKKEGMMVGPSSGAAFKVRSIMRGRLLVKGNDANQE